MPVTVVVGGQYGSEGKGKVCAHLASAGEVDVMVRCGGPNSGHTVDLDGQVYELKQVPAGFVQRRARLLLAPGALVKPKQFLEEMAFCGLDPSRIGIDSNAGVIEDSDVEAEKVYDLRGRLGSTGVGMGSAVSRRVLRHARFRIAEQVPELSPFITHVAKEISEALRVNSRVVVEGTQGFGLSLYHTEEWPYCTSRDTTAHAFLSEAGIGAREYEVIMAVRTYPIRVGGNSGPLFNEISWDEIQRRSGYPTSIAEYTTTTKRLRRVGEFDWDVVGRAIEANQPTMLALHGSDYIDYRNREVSRFEDLSHRARGFIAELSDRFAVPVGLIGTGPRVADFIDVRRSTLARSRQAKRA